MIYCTRSRVQGLWVTRKPVGQDWTRERLPYCQEWRLDPVIIFMALDGQNSMHKGTFSFKHKSHVGKIATFKPPSLSKYILMLPFSEENSWVWWNEQASSHAKQPLHFFSAIDIFIIPFFKPNLMEPPKTESYYFWPVYLWQHQALDPKVVF